MCKNPTDGTTVTYPLKSIVDGGRKLVSSISIDQGNGQQYLTSKYTYEGLATDVTGRGEQGFERITVVGPTTPAHPLGTIRTTHYAQGFPYTGMELGHKVTSGTTGNVMEQTANTVAVMNNYLGSSSSGISQTSYQTSPVTLPSSVMPLAYTPNPGFDTAIHPFVQSAAQLVHADLDGTPLPLTTVTIPAGMPCQMSEHSKPFSKRGIFPKNRRVSSNFQPQ